MVRARIAVAVCLSLASIALVGEARAQDTFQVMHAFTGADGKAPQAPLVELPNGDFCGTTTTGGALGFGTIFRMTNAGVVTVLYNFANGLDGSPDSAPLIFATDGALYGTTQNGGSAGVGTIYRLTLDGAFTIVHEFAGSDGRQPSSLFQDADGNFYGTTLLGGTAPTVSPAGTIFSLSPDGILTTLKTFSSSFGVGGFRPTSLIRASDGNFYGTASDGGTNGFDRGSVFRLTPGGDFTVVNQFRQQSDTGAPGGPRAILEGRDGNFYVTASSQNLTGYAGIWRVTPAGQRTILFEFDPLRPANGQGPSGRLIQLSDGRLYGTTTFGGDARKGSVFRLALDKTFTTLYSFTGAADGDGPRAGLTQNIEGALYGTASAGGAGASGVVFRIAPVPGPAIGVIDTPEPQAVVAGEVAFTGWVIDDSGIIGVDVYRAPEPGEPTQPNGLVFVGVATMLNGVRPDVVTAFPLYPGVTGAGWGLMILSNSLPHGGNGPVTLYAVARCGSGEQQIFASRAIVTANASSTQPFGTIDTPGQGATVSGMVVNFGWALTPQPKMIPVDGSTIDVYIDGVIVGHPSYGHFRPDIASQFPGYANSNGAVGFFQFDSAMLANGLHTISWGVRDNSGAEQGIGSRYFWVLNPQ